ncbi:capsule biosynthesis GfcC family protein [Luteibacter aegosomatissinici]|uniref:capsule biosynthesis GfcC family protein n=1 Tax=Luteibacter aegosomatissinici TaxID=2911539 RepID=UPI001FF95B47|nr:capsule biosynthesis GfcC family protein [Luteibacter aegosomatissinici]UPG92594.1 capsule biosynthesis GfcC family protein [Luteibacter aegosomatissinici]
MRRPAWVMVACAVAALLAASASAEDALRASASGEVRQAGSAVYSPGARLADLALAARVNPDAYMAGAAWLRPSLHEAQVRLKAGVVFELGVIRMDALTHGKEDLGVAAAAFHAWITTLPVTGRRTSVVLDPDRLEVSAADNWPIEEGDALFYPRRPSTIRIVGAVGKPCSVPHVALQDARRYLVQCPASVAADPDMIFVIQPDGSVFPQNIAAWNRDPPRVLAPGAWIYVPFNRKAIAGVTDGQFNEDAAAFISTQLVGAEGSP